MVVSEDKNMFICCEQNWNSEHQKIKAQVDFLNGVELFSNIYIFVSHIKWKKIKVCMSSGFEHEPSEWQSCALTLHYLINFSKWLRTALGIRCCSNNAFCKEHICHAPLSMWSWCVICFIVFQSNYVFHWKFRILILIQKTFELVLHSEFMSYCMKKGGLKLTWSFLVYISCEQLLADFALPATGMLFVGLLVAGCSWRTLPADEVYIRL